MVVPPKKSKRRIVLNQTWSDLMSALMSPLTLPEVYPSSRPPAHGNRAYLALSSSSCGGFNRKAFCWKTAELHDSLLISCIFVHLCVCVCEVSNIMCVAGSKGENMKHSLSYLMSGDGLRNVVAFAGGIPLGCQTAHSPLFYHSKPYERVCV